MLGQASDCELGEVTGWGVQLEKYRQPFLEVSIVYQFCQPLTQVCCRIDWF